MPFDPSIFGEIYLDVETYRAMAALLGVGMALCDYPDTNDGNLKLTGALAAASRMIDTFVGKTFSADDRSETHKLDLDSWRFQVNNPPVISISNCTVRYAVDGTIVIPADRIYINNQQNYCEITRLLDGSLFILNQIGTELVEPFVEVVYKSLQSIPSNVRLACGYQAAHLINSGFVDATLPANFGKLDIGGISINNKKGYRTSEEMKSGSLSADAERLLTSEIRFSAA